MKYHENSYINNIMIELKRCKYAFVPIKSLLDNKYKATHTKYMI